MNENPHNSPILSISDLHESGGYDFHIYDADPEDFDLWTHEFSEAAICNYLMMHGIFEGHHPISFDGREITLSHTLVSIHTNSLNRGKEISSEEFWGKLVGVEK